MPMALVACRAGIEVAERDWAISRASTTSASMRPSGKNFSSRTYFSNDSSIVFLKTKALRKLPPCRCASGLRQEALKRSAMVEMWLMAVR